MLPFILFSTPFALLAITSNATAPNKFIWVLMLALSVLFVGLRHHVGMDWNNYLVMISRVSEMSFLEAINFVEPAYGALLWLGNKSGYGIYMANFISSCIFVWGLFTFARRLPDPWLAVMVAIPYLVIVIAMSANRQAAAIGVLLFISAKWYDYGMLKKIFWILVASTFHISAIFLLLFIGLSLRVHLIIKFVSTAVLMSMIIYIMLASDSADYYNSVYFQGQSALTQSSGAKLHVLLNGIPALLILLGGRLKRQLLPTPLLKQMAYMAIALIPMSYVFSAASGRMTLYLFPISMYVISKLPTLFKLDQRRLVKIVIVGVYTFLLWFWLSYANSAKGHLPYQNMLFTPQDQLAIF